MAGVGVMGQWRRSVVVSTLASINVVIIETGPYYLRFDQNSRPQCAIQVFLLYYLVLYWMGG